MGLEGELTGTVEELAGCRMVKEGAMLKDSARGVDLSKLLLKVEPDSPLVAIPSARHMRASSADPLVAHRPFASSRPRRTLRLICRRPRPSPRSWRH